MNKCSVCLVLSVCQDIMVSEGNSDIVSVTSDVYPNPKDIFTPTGTQENAQRSAVTILLTFVNPAKVNDVKLTVTNAYKTKFDLLREDGTTASSKVWIIFKQVEQDDLLRAWLLKS